MKNRHTQKRPSPLSFRKSPGALVGGLEPLAKVYLALGIKQSQNVYKSKNITKII